MEELKPCPFCGGEDVRISPYDGAKTVVCMNCLCMTAKYLGEQAEERAAAAWNNRPDGWISVEDKLPTVDKYGDVYVLVHMDDGFIATATYDKNNGWELWAESGEVTHWQPLPESPKGE